MTVTYVYTMIAIDIC